VTGISYGAAFAMVGPGFADGWAGTTPPSSAKIKRDVRNKVFTK
jgi:hypothetical protein